MRWCSVMVTWALRAVTPVVPPGYNGRAAEADTSYLTYGQADRREIPGSARLAPVQHAQMPTGRARETPGISAGNGRKITLIARLGFEPASDVSGRRRSRTNRARGLAADVPSPSRPDK